MRAACLAAALAMLAPGAVEGAGQGSPGAAGSACEAADFAPRGRLESPTTVLVYRTRPEAIEIGRHFAVDAIVCARSGAAGPVTGLRVDAQMPEHRHGMNYRPRVSPAGDGRFTAEGFLFHMPGRWRLQFDVERGGRTERLETDVILE